MGNLEANTKKNLSGQTKMKKIQILLVTALFAVAASSSFLPAEGDTEIPDKLTDCLSCPGDVLIRVPKCLAHIKDKEAFLACLDDEGFNLAIDCLGWVCCFLDAITPVEWCLFHCGSD